MKSLLSVLAVMAMLVSGSTFAAEAALVIFGGTGQTQSGGVSGAQTQGSGGSAIFGATQTNSGAVANNNGAANATVLPSGTTSSHTNTSTVAGGMNSVSFGLAGSGSSYGSGAVGSSGAAGTHGSVGLGIIVLP